MANISSEVGIFNVAKANSNDNKQNTETLENKAEVNKEQPNDEVEVKSNDEPENIDVEDEDLTIDDNFLKSIGENKVPYIDKRSVTIMLARNQSLFREANRSTLPKRIDYIGSSVNSSKILSSNKAELEKYFPAVVGTSPNSPEFISRVKDYLNNIQVKVDEFGRKFDISFRYEDIKIYNKFKAMETKIENNYKYADKHTDDLLRKALNAKIEAIHQLESLKVQFGYPMNVEDYIIYRHCLLYPDIAKDTAIINSSPNIRFYFKDDAKEAERLKRFRIDVNRAKVNYVACIGDPKLFDAVYIQYCVLNNLPVLSSLVEDTIQKEIKLDKFSQEQPVKFNKIFNNKDVILIGQIEMLIARSILYRSVYNQNITTPDGNLIGANMQEAIAWFKNPEHTSEANAYLNQLKNI